MHVPFKFERGAKTTGKERNNASDIQNQIKFIWSRMHSQYAYSVTIDA